MSSILEKRKCLNSSLIQHLEERVLHFKLLFDADIYKVKKALDDAEIKYICGDKDSYYASEFFVRRGNMTWKNIKEIVESVKPTFFECCLSPINFKIITKSLYIYDGKFIDLCN